MNSKTSFSIGYRSLLALLLLLELAITGCSNLTPTENALMASGAVGAATGIALGASGVNSAITLPVALGSAALAGGGTYLYAKNRATIDQRRIAEARARLYYAQQGAPQRYLAVNAPNGANAQGQSVMLYDTQTGSVGNTVYDLKRLPAPGQTTSLGNTSATYIGSGN
ncbi:MAG: hypothetical protein K2W99_08135 [Chthoniobacterales bacterium]|nr:hypothetical protein [Chthoniobacterales bacterium]